MYYRGTVTSYQAASGLHSIYYDDGQRVKERLTDYLLNAPKLAERRCVKEMRHRWLPDDAEVCIFGLTQDSLPETPVVEPVQQLPAGSPKLARSRRGGKSRPKGGKKRSAAQAEQAAPLLKDLQEPLLFDSFDDPKPHPPKQEPGIAVEETQQESKRLKLGAEDFEHHCMPAVATNPGLEGEVPSEAVAPESLPADVPQCASEAISLAVQLDENVGVAKPSTGAASLADPVVHESTAYNFDPYSQHFMHQANIARL